MKCLYYICKLELLLDVMRERLVSEVIAGSHKSYEVLYNKWVSHLYRFVFSLTKSDVITQDIVQDTFVKIWTNRAQLNAELSFKSYLFTISYRMVLKEFRQHINHPQMENYMKYCNDSSLCDSSADQALDFNNFLIELNKAKKKLSPRQRQIFELSKEYNLTISEIADKLSLSDASVRNQLSVALKIIRKELSIYYSLFLFYISF